MKQPSNVEHFPVNYKQIHLGLENVFLVCHVIRINIYWNTSYEFTLTLAGSMAMNQGLDTLQYLLLT